MGNQASFEDANLILKLYELRREERLRQARDWFSKNFRAKTMEDFQKLCPAGSKENESYRMVISYWEMVASFVASGVLNPELFYQSGQEILLVYERLRTLLPEMRIAFKSPYAYTNLENVSEQFIEWHNKRAPEAYAAFAARIG
jgi:hypothetical protein